MIPAVAYARVSSDEQAKAGFSIPFQQRKIDAYASANRYAIAGWFVDAHSAKDPGRPEFEAMVAHIPAHPEVRTVLVHKLDRVCRNLTDWATLRGRLNVHVLAIEEPIADTPLGRLTRTFGAGMACFYVENLSQEVLKGHQAKFDAGGFNTKAPVGYKNVTRTRTQRAHVVVDPERAPLIVRMFERYAGGDVSLADLSEELFDLGLRTKRGLPFSQERIRKLLHHPFYKGTTVYRHQERPGVHEPLVSSELWETVQEVSERRHRSTGDKGARFYLLRGLLWCGACGHRFTAQTGARGSYYRCVPDARRVACRQPYVPVKHLDTEVAGRLADVGFQADELAALLRALEQVQDEHDRMRQCEESGIRAALGALDAKITRLTDGFASGLVPEGQYRDLVARYRRDFAAREARLRFLTADLSEDVALANAALADARSLSRLFLLAPTDLDKKALLRRVFARIEVTDKAITRIEYNPPFHLFTVDARHNAGVAGLEHELLEAIARTHRAAGAA
jgi:DNA invertase Pin-like site-specific DNA recombinase